MLREISYYCSSVLSLLQGTSYSSTEWMRMSLYSVLDPLPVAFLIFYSFILNHFHDPSFLCPKGVCQWCTGHKVPSLTLLWPCNLRWCVIVLLACEILCPVIRVMFCSFHTLTQLSVCWWCVSVPFVGHLPHPPTSPAPSFPEAYLSATVGHW